MPPAALQNRLRRAQECLLARDYQRALPLYQTLVRDFPNLASAWFEYGNAACGMRDLDLADRAWQRALQLEPRNAELVGLIGHQYQGARRPEQARACFAQAASADPRGINPRISLAVLLEQNHRLDEARAAVQQCLGIDKRDDQARYFWAVLDRRESKLEAAETGLRDLLRHEPKHPYVRYAARYELAQVLDRTDRFDEAAEVLAEAKRLVRSLTDTALLIRAYDEDSGRTRRFTEALPKSILSTWAATFPPAEREALPQLAFLGGHPRSGTTLLEQILDAHPAVAALDEPTAFQEVLQPAFFRSTELSSQKLNLIRKEYIGALLQELGPSAAGKLLVDKNPSPTSRLPVWLRVFPELKVLIALRDPRDVVLSCYFQNIPLNGTNVNFLSFERLARHYADLMDIWLAVRQWEGFAWTEVRYEDMVQETERHGRRVTEFLGLTWEESQAKFYEKSRRKQFYSPTYQDVTRPIYHKSIGRWRAYEKHLAPILPALQRYVELFGYQ